MSDTITFVKTSAETIYNDLLSGLENNLETPLYPGDQRRLFAEALAAVLVVFYNDFNESAKARLLQYASGSVLDAIGARVNCPRLQATPATTTIKFFLAAPRTVDTVIPKGTRGTADATVYFATDLNAAIPAGELSVEVPTTATATGTAGNGYDAGTITTLVDGVPYIAGITNTTTSSGADNGEPYPEADNGVGDNHYRARIALANNQYTTAGPSEAYEYHTLSANADIEDVKVDSEQTAGTVDIYITGKGGTDPTDGMIADVLARLTDKKVRPLNDNITCQGPTVELYDIEIKYYVAAANEAPAYTNIEGTGGAIEQFIKWQDAKIGRDINPDKLRTLCLNPGKDAAGNDLIGCYRLDVISPAFTALTNDKIARFSGTLTVTHEIVEE